MVRSPRPRSAREALAGLQFVLSPVARPNPVVIAWRWRYEIGFAAGVPLGLITLVRVLSLTGMLITVVVLACAATVWPPARRQVIARAWCVITPHRVRTGCAQAWIHSRRGKIPVILLTIPRPFGERVHLWCRAGTCAADLIGAHEVMIAACWARDIQVSRSPRFAQLVTLDIIRYALPGQPDDPEPGPRPDETPTQQTPDGEGDGYPWWPGAPTGQNFGAAA